MNRGQRRTRLICLQQYSCLLHIHVHIRRTETNKANIIFQGFSLQTPLISRMKSRFVFRARTMVCCARPGKRSSAAGPPPSKRAVFSCRDWFQVRGFKAHVMHEGVAFGCWIVKGQLRWIKNEQCSILREESSCEDGQKRNCKPNTRLRRPLYFYHDLCNLVSYTCSEFDPLGGIHYFKSPLNDRQKRVFIAWKTCKQVLICFCMFVNICKNRMYLILVCFWTRTKMYLIQRRFDAWFQNVQRWVLYVFFFSDTKDIWGEEGGSCSNRKPLGASRPADSWWWGCGQVQARTSIPNHGRKKQHLRFPPHGIRGCESLTCSKVTILRRIYLG